MKFALSASLALLVHCGALAQDNLTRFKPPALDIHPICGIHPDFDGTPRFPQPPPFAPCTTLVAGYSADVTYTDKGIQALAQLLVAVAEAGNPEQRFRPLNPPPLHCRPNLPLGIGPPQPPPMPVCTLVFVQTYLRAYNEQPGLSDYRRYERILKGLDLSNQSTIDKLTQATAVVRATGESITFKDIGDLLE